MMPIPKVNSTGLVDAEPASRNDMFMSAPKNAARPVRQPKMRPRPTAISPNTMSGANQDSACALTSMVMKSRYHSKAIGGEPVSGMVTARAQ